MVGPNKGKSKMGPHVITFLLLLKGKMMAITKASVLIILPAGKITDSWPFVGHHESAGHPSLSFFNEWLRKALKATIHY